MLSRRKLLGMLAAGAIIAPSLLISRKSIFLPPVGGWPRNALATMIIPREHLEYYAEGLAAGRFAYDDATETMSILQLDPAHHQGKWHSTSTGREYTWQEQWDETPVVNNAHPLGAMTSLRAKIDDEADLLTMYRGQEHLFFRQRLITAVDG